MIPNARLNIILYSLSLVYGLGSSADLYTQVLYNYYSPPDGFCFDIVCGINPIVDDKRSPEYNVEAKVNIFIK